MSSIHPSDNNSDDVTLPPLVSEHLLNSGPEIDVTNVASGCVSELMRLRDRLVLSFDARAPATCRLWPRNPHSRNDVSSRREQVRARVSDVSVLASFDLNTDLAPKLHHPLRVALSGVGGIASLLFLAAKVTYKP